MALSHTDDLEDVLAVLLFDFGGLSGSLNAVLTVVQYYCSV